MRAEVGVRRALIAGSLYFAVLFLLGMTLGPLREFLLAPWIGALAAVAAEAVPMLLASALVAGQVVRSLGVGPGTGVRLAMGGVALALMVTAETALTALLRGQGPGWWLEQAGTGAGRLSLALLAGFGIMPLLVARGPDRRPA